MDLSRSREEIERQLVDDLGADDADDLDAVVRHAQCAVHVLRG